MQIITSSDAEKDYWHWSGGIDPTITFDARGMFRHDIPSNGDLGLALGGRSDGLEFLYVGENGLMPCYALFGGVAVPGIRLYGRNIEDRYFWAAEELQGIPEDLHLSGFSNPKTRQNRMKAMLDFLAKGRVDLEDWSVEHGVTHGLVTLKVHSPWSQAQTPYTVQVFSDLFRNIGLDRVVPGHEIHQAMARFIGGVLTESREIPEFSDLVKRDAHGFDKMSFKNRGKGK